MATPAAESEEFVVRSHPYRTARTRARGLILSVLAVALVAPGAAPAYAAYEDTEPPSRPGPITVVEATNTTLLISWEASTDNVGVVEYQIGMRYEDFGRSFSSPTNSLRIDALSPSHTYYLTVRARDAAGNASASSPELRVTMPPGDSEPPTVPGRPVASEIAATSVRLTWAHSTDNVMLARYDIMLVEAGGARRIWDVPQYPTGPNTTGIGNLTPSTTYTFAIRAVDDAGNASALSETVTVTTLPPPPPSCTFDFAQYPATGATRTRLVLRNTTATTIDGWTSSWSLPAEHELRGLRGAVLLDRYDGFVSVANASHNRVIRPGGSVTITYLSSAPAEPGTVWLKSNRCAPVS
ncbi:fibronectin type III domain-containing protein [Micromonospora sp. NPDC049559]|uniref:fibronectin type III domain-containing protein n=1 Tax=Micromonospora sp. NPDC049559 TaxID=3155923 RepID=UPI00341E5662